MKSTDAGTCQIAAVLLLPQLNLELAILQADENRPEGRHWLGFMGLPRALLSAAASFT